MILVSPVYLVDVLQNSCFESLSFVSIGRKFCKCGLSSIGSQVGGDPYYQDLESVRQVYICHYAKPNFFEDSGIAIHVKNLIECSCCKSGKMGFIFLYLKIIGGFF